MADNTEDKIHKIYEKLRKQNQVGGLNPVLLGKTFPATPPARFDKPSFRSQYFDTGRGITAVAPGETVIMAQYVVPANYLGVLTGFTQDFIDCGLQEVYQTVWGIRIHGNPVGNFPDFVGEKSKPYFPRHLYYPLLGGAEGTVSTSPGGSPTPQIPTVQLQVTNNSQTSVVLDARIIGYSFPIDETWDQFSNY